MHFGDLSLTSPPAKLASVERVFDHGRVSRSAVLAELRAGIDRLEGAEQDRRTLPTLPALAGLLPGRGLRHGSSYTVEGSTTLALALLAAPSEAGAWCGVVGVPTLGVAAAAEVGVELSRLLLVPDPGERWLEVTAALLDALDVVLVQPPTGRGARPASDGEVRRLAARLREREAVLLTPASWPGCAARLTAKDSTWHGLGTGHGHLSGRQLTVEVTGRGGTGRRSGRLWLPAPDGGVREVDSTVEDARPRLRSVG